MGRQKMDGTSCEVGVRATTKDAKSPGRLWARHLHYPKIQGEHFVEAVQDYVGSPFVCREAILCVGMPQP